MFTTRPEIACTFGAVTSTHWIASQVGMAVLERGGNAFDAAVAAGFTLQIAEPHLNGPGGDVPIIFHAARPGTQHVLCGQGPAPAAARPEIFAELGLDLIPGTGLLPAVIPGAFDAWCLMLRDWGTWELRDVMAYAIGYARNGVHVVPNISVAIASLRELFQTEWRSSAEVFLPNGSVPEPGSLFARPAVAETFERLLSEAVGANREARIDAARAAWYQGFVAEAIDDFYGKAELLDVSGRRHCGLLRGQDLAGYAATIEEPATFAYHQYTMLKCGPWSQGPVFLQQLALLSRFELAEMDPLGADFVHTVAECAKLAFADRETFYGDPAFVDVPLSKLLSRSYNEQRRALVEPRASMDLRPGSLPGYDFGPALPVHRTERASAPGVGEPTIGMRGAVASDTCHLDVIDRWGNMVSATPSGGWLQSSPVVPGLGFCLSTRAQMFSLQAGSANVLAPGKRPRTTLSPSFALRDGQPWLAFGTPGGEQQDQWSLIFFLRVAHHRMNLQEAIDLPSFHTEHWPSSFWPKPAYPGKLVLEGRYADHVLKDLRERGHVVEKGGDWSEGRISAARREPDGRIFAAANARGMQGYAVGR